ncbi:hypothetical protein BDV93DRAFT_612242 [Ceratobasidium sp. AG-I]|nr:hypothetical protein BDV93DRAFT_612242 [Ceratobasidium sp. AG-I]
MSVREGSNNNSNPPPGILQEGTQSLDMHSEDAFPSLVPSAPAKLAAASAWASASRVHQAAPSTAPMFSDSFIIEDIDLSGSGKNETPSTLSEIMKHIMLQTKNLKLEASTQRKDGRARTSFVIKAETENDLEDAKRKLSAALSPVVTRIIQAPVSTRGAIIGRKGANLAQLRAKYGVRADIPRQGVNVNIPRSNTTAPHPDWPAPGGEGEEEEPTQPISVTGPLSSVTEAIAELNIIIAANSSKITQRVRDIPNNVHPFIASRLPKYYATAEAAGFYVTLTLFAPSHELVASGDRPGVVSVIQAVKADVEKLGESLSTIAVPLNKPQHHLLFGSFAEELMELSHCIVILPTDPDDKEVTLWGLQDDLPQGLQAVMKQANSMYTESLSVPAPSYQICDYLLRMDYFNKVMAPAYPGVQAYIMPRGKGHAVDMIGERPVVAAAIEGLQKVFLAFTDFKDSTPPGDLPNDTPMAVYPHDQKYYHNSDSVTFLVGGILFKLCKSILLYHMAQEPLPPAKITISDIEKPGKGASDSDPFVITGVTTQQFRWFLLLLLGTPADPEYESCFMLTKSARSHTKDDFLCHLGIYAITRYFGMSKLHDWACSRLKGVLKLATEIFNTSWDKGTIMQVATCLYEESHWLNCNLHAFILLTLSTSAQNNPIAHQLPVSSNLDTCVALYKDPSLPKTYPAIFGYVFTVILSLGHRSSVWTNQLTREDRNILYAAQVHLMSLGDDPDLDLSWLSQSPSKYRIEFCSDSCIKDTNTAWSASFALCGASDSVIPLVDVSMLVLLPGYRQLFADSARSNFKSCINECACNALNSIDAWTQAIFAAMCNKYKYFVEDA